MCLISAGCSRYWYTTSEMLKMRRPREQGNSAWTQNSMKHHATKQLLQTGRCAWTMTTDVPEIQYVCTLTFHHRNAIAASPRLTFHSATCDAGRGGLAVGGWQASSKPHPPANRCFIGRNASQTPSYIRVTIAASMKLGGERT